MCERPTGSTRNDTLFPDTTPVRSTRERLDATVQRLQVRSAGAHPDAATLAALIRQLDANRVPDKTPLSWITASAGKDTRLILVEDVAYFRADNKYTTVM